MSQWVVLVEAAGGDDEPSVSLETAQQLVWLLGDKAPIVLHSPRRFGAQFWVGGEQSDDALQAALAQWRVAIHAAGLPDWPVVRAEVMTDSELAAELASEVLPTHVRPERSYCPARRIRRRHLG
jgi:hypothetical protein